MACTREEPQPPPPVEALSPPVLEDGVDVPLARRLLLDLDGEARLTVTLRSLERQLVIRFPELADHFDVPVLGFTPDTRWDVVLSLTTDDGRSGVLATLPVDTEPLPPNFPEIEVLANDVGRSEGGYWLVPLEHPDGAFWLAIYDARDFSVVWLYDGPINWGDVRFDAHHHLFGLAQAAVEMDLLGNIVMGWTPSLVEGVPNVEIPWSLTHEVYPLADGSFWSIAAQTTSVDEYPISYEDPTAFRAAAIEDPLVVHVGYDGTVLQQWAMSTRLDTKRIGFDSLDLVPKGLDWTHPNAIIEDPSGGTVLSVRHQDALVGLDALGAPRWILGDPSGWGPDHADLLLAPAPGVVWPYHQHGPAFAPDGTLWVMDNHSVGGTPYELAEPVQGPSRIVGYAIDPVARTVAQAGEWYPPDELPSNALGSVDPLPRTGHFLVDFGMTRSEGGVLNVDAGRGQNTGRVMEVDPTDPDPVVDVRFSTDPADSAEGVNLYRVEPAASLYGDLATETLLLP